MNSHHLKSELAFYSQAFKNNPTRRQRKYSWGTTPSQVIISLLKTNKINGCAKHQRVLDLGCGDGRHARYFLDLGYEVVGVDFCKEAIKLCGQIFKNKKSANFYLVDLTVRNALARFGKFDTILDWSVLDHIRSVYLKNYIKNIKNALKEGGYLFVAVFDEKLPGLYEKKKYKLVRGHYSRGYTVNALKKLFPDFRVMAVKKSVLEDEINNYRFHTILFRKPE
ncbi:MAG: class I SAM-dependent methyltransferase [Patescibacteria group bacterium]